MFATANILALIWTLFICIFVPFHYFKTPNKNWVLVHTKVLGIGWLHFFWFLIGFWIYFHIGTFGYNFFTLFLYVTGLLASISAVVTWISAYIIKKKYLIVLDKRFIAKNE